MIMVRNEACLYDDIRRANTACRPDVLTTHLSYTNVFKAADVAVDVADYCINNENW